MCEHNPKHETEAVAQDLPQDERLTSKPNSLAPRLYYPLTLQTTLQITICIILLGIVGALEFLLRHSIDHQGIGDVPAYGYFHYLWTSLPAAVLTLIGAFFSSADSERRILAPFYALNPGPASIESSINLGILGLPTPQALYKQIRTENYVGALATVAALLTSFLAIASGSLFYETLSFNIPGRLRLTGSFTSELNSSDYDFIFGVLSGTGFGVNDFGIVSSLILESNLSYASFTFEEFALPELVWDSSEASAWSNTTGLETHAIVPALQSGLSCRQHPKSDIEVELLYFDPRRDGDADEYPWPAGERLGVNVTSEYCQYYGSSSNFDTSSSAVFFLGNGTKDGTFGVAWYGNGNSTRRSCSTYFYVWGSVNSTTSPGMTVSAMSCNASISAVDIEVTLSGPEFAIRENDRPRPRKGRKHDVIPANNSTRQFENSVYQDLTSFNSVNESLLDPFFSLLVHSRYAIPISALADPTQEKKGCRSNRFPT